MGFGTRLHFVMDRMWSSRWTLIISAGTAILMFLAVSFAGIVRLEYQYEIIQEHKREEATTGFEQFAEGVEGKYGHGNMGRPSLEPELTFCGDVDEPEILSGFPLWIKAEQKMRKDVEVEEVMDGVFVRGEEMAITKCDFETLFDAIDYTEPAFKGADENPYWDIYLACGPGKHTVVFSERINVGRQGTHGHGMFRIIAPDENVVLDGNQKSGLFRVETGAHLTLYGLTLQNAKLVNMDREASAMPRGGCQGAAVLVMTKASLVVHQCTFENNTAVSSRVRLGGGGAIKLEPGSKGLVWGCSFNGNRASVGGAIAASSATVLYIGKSTFRRNVAVGGLAPDTEEQLLVQGGAVHVDSIESRQFNIEHVVMCKSKFLHNRITMRNHDVAKYGLDAGKALTNMDAGAAAIYTWSAPKKIFMDEAVRHFLTMKDLVFDGNEEDIEAEGSNVGLYVFEADGAGDADVQSIEFSNNRVRGAVAKFDSSDSRDSHEFYLIMHDIKFNNNGNTKNLAFESKSHASRCNIKAVEGLSEFNTDCSDGASEAVSSDEPVLILAMGEPILMDMPSIDRSWRTQFL